MAWARSRPGNGLMELAELVPDRGVEVLGVVLCQHLDFDHLLDIGQILEPVRRGHPRGKFQLDKLGQRNGLYASNIFTIFRGVREHDWLRLAVARVFPRRDDLDSDALITRFEFSCGSGKRREVASADQLVPEFLESFLGQEQVDIYRQALVAMLVQSDRAD